MIPVLLTQIKTQDGIRLDGIYIKPRRRVRGTLVFIHGLTGNFYGGMQRLNALSRLAADAGFATAAFNTRGHDIATSLKKKKKRAYGGTAFERFKACTHDIDAVMRFLKKKRHKNIFLVGHSTGANKALYYAYKKRGSGIKGLILLGPMNDIAEEHKRIGSPQLRRNVALAKRLKPNQLMPARYGFLSAQRYRSLYEPRSAEDVFPYYNKKAQWKELKSIRVPIAVIIGSRDEYLDRRAEELIEIFRTNAPRAKPFDGVIIKGAGHSFVKKEKELAKTIVNWIKKI